MQPSRDPISPEIDESLIRAVFLKNRQKELFIQDAPELERASQAYRESYHSKEERRLARFCVRLGRAKNDYGSMSLAEYRSFGKKGFFDGAQSESLRAPARFARVRGKVRSGLFFQVFEN